MSKPCPPPNQLLDRRKRPAAKNAVPPTVPANPSTSRSRAWSLGTRTALFVALFGVSLPACGNTIYAVYVNAASAKLEEAKQLRAEELAPYEYYMAVEHLSKAREEAANADYGDAVHFAEVSEEHADKAIRVSQEAHRSAGR